MKKIIIIIFLTLFLSACARELAQVENKPMYKNLRQPAVAGQFYPSDPEQLELKIKEYLNNATATTSGDIKAIMVPHAGYDYSGPVAAYSYKELEGRKYDTVVIICNSHSSYFDGVAIDDADAWQMPLGTVEVDKELANKLTKADSSIKFNGSAHRYEHSLEVQLPFLQTVLPKDFKIVPILFGNTGGDSYKKLAKALADNLGEHDLVVISTDMSHYPGYKDANRIDPVTLGKIKSADIAALEKHITDTELERVPNEDTLLCGIDGVKIIMELYKLAGWDKITILHYANSGDVTGIGDKSRVVGYGAVAFIGNRKSDTKNQKQTEAINNISDLNEQQEKILINIATTTVNKYIQDRQISEFNIIDERLNQREGAFVTLNKNGQLRGCIGQIVPTDKPLWQVVRDMAIAAATTDPRFQPVSKEELSQLTYEVSVLSKPEPVSDWHKIELGRHGVIVSKGWQSGVFLPQVATETGWDLETFLSELCLQKAGLKPDAYKNDPAVELQVFTAQVVEENNTK